MVMVNLKNIKTNWPKKKWDDNWDKPQPILAIYKRVVVVDFLDHIYINKFFYILKVCLQFPKEIPSQTHINKKECHNIINRITERDNNGNITNKWEFKKILNIYNK